MAIKKTVKAKNGVVTEYHRIAMIKMDINQQNTILVHSYLSEEGRQIEKDYAAGKYAGRDFDTIEWPYVKAEYITTEYDGQMTIDKAYDYLKTLEKFNNSNDI